jgi:hypothetical protein
MTFSEEMLSDACLRSQNQVQRTSQKRGKMGDTLNPNIQAAPFQTIFLQHQS